jgi:hypothetical protein
MAQSKKRAPAPYASKIIKAGALLADTQLLLAHWDLAATSQENLARIQQENLFGKTSRARVSDILAIFRQRYVADPHMLSALVTLARANVSSATLVPIYYFLAARADPLLRDATLEVIAPLAERGETTVRIETMERWLQEQVRNGRTQKPWSDPTITRIARGLLATLRDFGVLQGQVNKRIAPVYLPATAFAFVAFVLSHERRSGERVLHDPIWRLFLLSDSAVERHFLEAHQERLLDYNAAGRVVRIDYPGATLEEYADVIAARTH